MTATAVKNDEILIRPDSLSLSRWDCLSGPFSMCGVTVRPKDADDIVVARFAPDAWRNIFADIDSDTSLNQFLDRESVTCRAYMLSRDGVSQPFGWIFIRRHDDVFCDSIEFHGGAWASDPGACMAKFRASILVIDAALRMGIRVTSRAYRHNTAALRFLNSIGFRIVRRASRRPWHTLTLSRRRFRRSPLVRRLMG